MKLAICNETYRDWDWSRAFAHARQHGYSGVEVAPFTLGGDDCQFPQEKIRQLKSIASQESLQIIGLHWLLAFTEGYHLTSADAEIQRATSSYLARLSQLCRELGGNVMVFGSPHQRSYPPEVSNAEAVDYACTVIENALPAFENHNVVLALEPLGEHETNFLNTAEQAIEICQRFDSPNVRLHLDVKAMSCEAKPIPQIIRESREWIEHFHANDPNLRGPGMGDVDFVPILKALSDIDYDKWISVEVFDQEISIEELVEQSSSYLLGLASC